MQQKNNYHLAIDIGASSGRHILGYEENGILKTEEIYRFQNGPVEKAGTAGALGATGAKRLTWDAARLYSEILNGLKRAKELGKIPATVGIDTWGVDYVLLDARFLIQFRKRNAFVHGRNGVFRSAVAIGVHVADDFVVFVQQQDRKSVV